MQRLTSEVIAEELAAEHRAHASQMVDELERPPRLDIVLGVGSAGVDGPSANYVGRKEHYGRTVGIEVVTHELGSTAVEATVHVLNRRHSTDGLIVQLPLPDLEPTRQSAICNQIAREKDVDALNHDSQYEPATPLAILHMLDNHAEADLPSSRITVVGSEGKLIGTPLVRMLHERGLFTRRIDTKLGNAGHLREAIEETDVLITATGVPGLITPDMLHDDMTIIDAGVAAPKPAGGSGPRKQQGDLAEEVFSSELDIWATPPTGAIGPLTVRMLFGNVLLAAQRSAEVRQAA